jgi:hypothetical protein
MWINQPSTLQDYHKLNGKNVLADMTEEQVVDIYFLSGEVVSQRISRMALSEGWHK